MTKNEVRQLIKTRLSEMSEANRNENSEKAVIQLVQLLSKVSNPSECIGFFSSMKDEIQWEKSKDLLKDFNFAFPSQAAEVIRFKSATGEVVTPKILIIPGLAFGKKGERLGRGKGFYDQYLEKFQGTTIGFCFEMQIMEVPTEPHDCKMDYLVTEKHIYHFKGKI